MIGLKMILTLISTQVHIFAELFIIEFSNTTEFLKTIWIWIFFVFLLP